MKKILTLLLVTMLSVPAFSQTRIGVEGGLNVSYMTGLNTLGFSTAPFAGGHLGVFNETKITDVLGFRAGVEYSMHGIMTSFTKHDFEWIFGDYLIVPVLMTFSLSDDRILLGVGPQLGVCCSMKDRWAVRDPLLKTTLWDTYKFKPGEDYNVCDCSIDVLARFLLNDFFGIKVQYNFGVTDVFKSIAVKGRPALADGLNGNFVGQVGVFFLFNEL